MSTPPPESLSAALSAALPADSPAAETAGTGWLREFHARDVDELAGAQVDWRLDYAQLSGGRYAGSVRQVGLDGIQLVLECSSHAVRQRGRLDAQHIGIALGLSTASGGAGLFHGQRLADDTLMIGRGDELDLVTTDTHQLIAMLIDATLLGRIWQDLYQKPWSPFLDHKLAVPARPGMADHVRTVHLAALQRVVADPALLHDPKAARLLRDAVLLEWLEAIPERVEIADLRTLQARRRLVDRACERVLGVPDQALSLLQVCQHVEASPRQLDLAFRDVLDTTPARYLKVARLNGVRRLLRQHAQFAAETGQTPPTVADLAARWGFWHLGAFAADYRQQFGELPSSTLGRNGVARCAQP
ncbi:helix-turn-helix domain-containing protein [Leptothrix sp. BB-4]